MIFHRGRAALLVLCLLAAACKAKTQDNDGSALSNYDTGSSAYSGHANYRLLLVGYAGPQFDPNQDILRPGADDKAQEQVSMSLRASALKSLIPIMGQINGSVSGTEENLMASLMALVDSARKSLADGLAPVLQDSSNKFPVVSEAWLLPWTEETTDFSYDRDKISLSPTETANVLKALPGSDGFNKNVSERIQKLRTKLKADTKTPVFLLASRYFLFVNPGKSRLTIRTLVGLQPYSGPFEKDDPKVKFDKVTVPDLPGKGITAAITFDIPLEENDPPMVTAVFGDFRALEKGNFEMDASGGAKTSPRLEGKANKTGTRWIALNFAFRDMSVNLRTAQLDQLTTLVSPGLKVGKGRWTVGGIHAESIDTTFQTEINNTIDGEIKKAMTNANDTILDGLLTKDMLEQAFTKIFHRG
jgi:hypothetical protein